MRLIALKLLGAGDEGLRSLYHVVTSVDQIRRYGTCRNRILTAASGISLAAVSGAVIFFIDLGILGGNGHKLDTCLIIREPYHGTVYHYGMTVCHITCPGVDISHLFAIAVDPDIADLSVGLTVFKLIPD